MSIAELLAQLWPLLAAGLVLLISLAASAHVLLKKQQAQAAMAWMGIIWLVPVLGSLLYGLFGINRVRRRAQSLRHLNTSLSLDTSAFAVSLQGFEDSSQWSGLKQLLDRLTHAELLSGNRVDVLHNGNQAYPEMLHAIQSAKRSIALATYIFGNDEWGTRFVEALAQAVGRGVQVKVLIDGVGQYYSWPSITRKLSTNGIDYALFLHSVLPWRMAYLNLRNHRKLLIVDGELAFTGGINLRDKHVGMPPKARDLHFKVQGPVVSQMMRIFAEDWQSSTHETLSGMSWFPPPKMAGKALARGIADGPDENYDQLKWALMAALGEAQSNVFILTPYFLPDQGLQDALKHAALRGVQVDILLPEKNNWPFMNWASHVLLPDLIKAGCRVWWSAPPFDHSKVMLVDDAWVLLGSGNWDPRSLRLNFEFNVEVYDGRLAKKLKHYVLELMKQAKPLSLDALLNRSLWRKLRDGLVHLASPYL